jgi:hypothetical protein
MSRLSFHGERWKDTECICMVRGAGWWEGEREREKKIG